MIYKKYEISKQEDVFTGKGFVYVIHSPNKDDYYHHAKTLQTCKKWIDNNEFPVRPLTPARKAKLEKEKGEKGLKKGSDTPILAYKYLIPVAKTVYIAIDCFFI